MDPNRVLEERLTQFFSLDEIKDICSDLGINYDSLTGDSKKAKVKELLTLVGKTGHLIHLVNICKKERPMVRWDDAYYGDIQHHQTSSTDGEQLDELIVAQYLNTASQNVEELGTILYRVFTLIADFNIRAKHAYEKTERLGNVSAKNFELYLKVLKELGDHVKEVSRQLKLQTVLLSKATIAVQQSSSLAFKHWPNGYLNTIIALWIINSMKNGLDRAPAGINTIRSVREGFLTWKEGPPTFIRSAKRAISVLDNLEIEYDKTCRALSSLYEDFLSTLENNLEANADKVQTDDQMAHRQISGSLPIILLVTVTKVEAQAVLELFSEDAGIPWQREHIGDKTYHALGIIAGACVYMVKSEMGGERSWSSITYHI